MTKNAEISDEKIAIAFKSIMSRISNEAIDEMIEMGAELNSNGFIRLLVVKFERYHELLASAD